MNKMIEKPLLSVVIAAYNEEKFIEKCVHSVMAQTYKNIEIVIVDDGSMDSTGKICDAISQTDGRVRVIHQFNQGLIVSRRNGVLAARGQYITFVDSDDWIEKDMYYEMMNIMIEHDVDLVCSGIIIEDVNSRVISKEETTFDEGYYDKEALWNSILPRMMWDEEIQWRGLDSAVWNKIYRAKQIKEVLESINEKVRLGEDALITYSYIINNSSIYILKKAWYHYVRHENSMCNSNNMEVFQEIKAFQYQWYGQIDRCSTLTILKDQVDKYIQILLGIATKNVYGIDINTHKYIFPFDVMPQGKVIVIYGAGTVGKSYWKCLHTLPYAKKLYWIDKEFKSKRAWGNVVESPGILKQIVFDYVIIAVLHQETADDIKRDLIHRWNIPEGKIVWVKPQRL